jgi:hypothetical protein
MEILVGRPRVPKLGPGPLFITIIFCIPAAIVWVGAGLTVLGVWGGWEDLAATTPLWMQAGIMALPLVGGALAALIYVRQLRAGHGDWRLLGVVALATALIVGTGVAAFTLYQPKTTATPSAGAAGGRSGGGGAGPARPSGGGGRRR